MTAGPDLLAERESQQARAQQHEAGRGQREESVRDQIVIAHVTPAMWDARPNLLRLSEQASWKEVMRLFSLSGFSGPIAKTFKGMGQENPRAHQTHNRRNRLDHCKLPVSTCRRERTTAALHSQKDSIVGKADRWRLMIWRNRLSGSGTESP
jgi:hypothetical protein